MRGYLIAAAIVVMVWGFAIGLLFVFGRKTAARELATLLPNLIQLFRGLIEDPRVPRGSKALLWVAAIWLLSPIDLVPEFLPVVGPLDDAIVAALVLRHVLKTAGREPVEEHWRGDPATLARILRVAGVKG
jgi:uncharacterized membrane protein YkvA (DUF1232 family)